MIVRVDGDVVTVDLRGVDYLDKHMWGTIGGLLNDGETVVCRVTEDSHPHYKIGVLGLERIERFRLEVE